FTQLIEIGESPSAYQTVLHQRSQTFGQFFRRASPLQELLYGWPVQNEVHQHDRRNLEHTEGKPPDQRFRPIGDDHRNASERQWNRNAPRGGKRGVAGVECGTLRLVIDNDLDRVAPVDRLSFDQIPDVRLRRNDDAQILNFSSKSPDGFAK